MRGMMTSDIPSLITSCKASGASLCIIYIEEAHAQDEWPIRSAKATVDGRPILYNKALTLNDRLRAAQDFSRDYKVDSNVINLVVDHIGNAFQDTYASWPIRWYVLTASSSMTTTTERGGGGGGGNVILNHIGQPEGAAFDFRVLKQILQKGRVSTPLQQSTFLPTPTPTPTPSSP